MSLYVFRPHKVSTFFSSSHLEYLDLLGLKEWAGHMPNEMSGG